MIDPTLLLRTWHGWLGVLAIALLLHPVVAGRPATSRGARWSVGLGIALATAAFASGWLIYPTYRTDLKPALLRLDRPLAAAFETKEHLAWYVLCLAVAGGGLLLVSREPGVVRTARWMLAVAAALGMVVALIGSFVGGFTPPR